MPLQLENMHTAIPTDYNYTSGQTDDFIDNLQWDSFTSLYLNGPMWTQFGHWWSRTFQSASGNSHCYYNFLFLKLCLFYTVWMVSVRRKELNADTRFSEVSCSCDWTPLVWGKSREAMSRQPIGLTCYPWTNDSANPLVLLVQPLQNITPQCN